MHRKGESRGLSATWWQVQKSVWRWLCSGTTTLSARRRGAATRARHLNGLPEGGSWIAGAASATVTLPGASTAAIPAWGTWFSCEWGQNNAGVRVSQMERVKDQLGFRGIHMVPDQQQEEGRGRGVSSERSPTRGNSSVACSKTSLESKREHVKIGGKNHFPLLWVLHYSYRPPHQKRRRTVAAWCRSTRTWSSCGEKTFPPHWAAPSRTRAYGRRSTRRCRRCWWGTLFWGSPVGEGWEYVGCFFFFLIEK